MNYYLKIQSRRFVRYFEERGLSVWGALVLLAIAFAGGSYFLNQRTEFAGWVILVVQIVVLFPLTGSERNDHLKLIFRSKQVLKVRIVENFILSTPFLLSLIFIDWRLVFVSILLAFLMTVWSSKRWFSRPFPTPFSHIPVQYPSGFRRLLLGHLLSIFICIFSMAISNYNLGLFTIILNWILIFAYYGKLEPLEYVWIHSKSPKELLLNKAREGFVGSSLIILPFVVCFVLLDLTSWYLPVIIYVLGILNMINIMFAMFTDFPDETSIPNGIIVALSVILPPLLIVSLLYFYKKAKVNLQSILHDTP